MSQNVKPATSVHLNYTLPRRNYNNVDNIVLRNRIKVKESHNHTYFCVLQFSPAGYCGIQQLQEENKKIAIFSVWDGDKETKCIYTGPNATVQKFGGEGNGLKCMKPFQWAIGEIIEFSIRARRGENNLVFVYAVYAALKLLVTNFLP